MAYTFRKANFNPISSLWMLVITLQFHVCSRVYIQCFDLSTLKIVLVFCITRLSVLRTNTFLCGVAGGNTRCVQRNRRSRLVSLCILHVGALLKIFIIKIIRETFGQCQQSVHMCRHHFNLTIYGNVLVRFNTSGMKA